MLELQSKRLGGMLARLVSILVEEDVDPAAELAGKLAKLRGRQVRTQAAGGIGKPSLPQHRQVEQSFDQDHAGVMADRFPGEQSALGAGKESMRKGSSGTAAVEVDYTSVLATRKDDTLVKGIVPRGVDRPRRRSKSKE